MIIYMTIYNKFLKKKKSVLLKLISTIFKVDVTVQMFASSLLCTAQTVRSPQYR